MLIFIIATKLYSSNIESKVDSINNKAWEISINHPTKAIEMSSYALRISDSISYLRGISNSSNFLGIFYANNNQLQIAEKYFFKAIKIRRKIGYTAGVAYVYDNLCGIKREEGDYKNAIKYGFKALKILDSLGKSAEEPTLFLNLALAHRFNEDYNDAKKYFNQGLQIAHRLKDTANIALINYNWADFYHEINQLKEATFHFNKALVLFKLLGQKPWESSAYNALATILTDKNDFGNAETLFIKSLKINSELKDSLKLFYNYFGLSQLFSKQFKFTQSLEFNQKAKSIISDKGGLDIYEMLNRQFAYIYQELNDYEKSLNHLKEAEFFKDSIFNINKFQNIAHLQKENAEREKAEAEAAKAEEEIKNQQLTQTLLLISLITLGLLFGLYIINQRRIQKSRELADVKEQQERIIDRRIIASSQEIRKELARNLHNHVSTPLTHIKRFIEPLYKQLSFDPEWQSNLLQALQIADKAHVVSRDISYQLKPEKIDWVDRIKISMVALEKNKTLKTNLSVKGLEENTFTRIQGEKISSIIGNLLSNVDTHSKATSVKVNIEQETNQLKIQVEDNGIGFQPEKDKGIGLESIFAGVEELNGAIKINSEKDKGTTVNILIPNHQQLAHAGG